MKPTAMLLTILVLFSAFCSSYGRSDYLYPNNRFRTDPVAFGALCRTGTRQSPINIRNDKFFGESNESCKVKIKSPSTGLSVKEHTFSLEMHRTSFQRQKVIMIIYSLEMHLVHQALNSEKENPTDYHLSVVAVLFELSDKDNEAISIIIDMIRERSTHRGLDKKIATYGDLLPKKLDYVYQYGGSLTTPPCDESVLWNVIAKTNTISMRQLQEFQSLNKNVLNNCRSEQKLNNRDILLISSMGFLDGASASTKVYRVYESLYLRIIFIILIFCQYLC